MPRPKRHKIAPSVPAPRGAKATIQRKDVVEDISDDEMNVRDARRGGVRNGEYTTGDMEDLRGRARSARIVGTENSTALEASMKRRDAAMERLEAENSNNSEHASSLSGHISSSPPLEVGRRAAAVPSVENSILAVRNFRRRARQPSILGRRSSKARSSSLESNLAASDGLTNFRSKENSLARGHFRRRQRQPSILGRTASRVRSSSIPLEMDRSTQENTDSAVRTGIFKKRSRQPSILGTGKKNQERRPEYDSDQEDEFNPEDESTPLNLSKTKSTTEQGSQSVSSAVNPRKRKLSSQATPSSPPRPAEQSEPSSVNHPSSPYQSAVITEEARPVTPERLSDTMAPPRSSTSPERLPESLRSSRRTNFQPGTRSERRQPVRKTLVPPNVDSLPSSPPSLTHSPNRPAVNSKRQGRGPTRPKPQPADFSTIQLQALLPRRRRRPTRGTFDVESSDDGEIDLSGLGSDDDELTHATIRTNRTTRSTAPRRVARLKPGPKATSSTGQDKSASKKGHTSRLAESDKENGQDESNEFEDPDQVDPGDSLAPIADTSIEDSQELEERVGKELKTAKRKFEVVDKWELEFEDVTAGSSSPWR